MPYDFLNNNPLLADMSPEKLQFLMNFATAKKPTDIKDRFLSSLPGKYWRKYPSLPNKYPEKK